ncbi:hypothetical protein [Bacillus manliponensis]|uniref:hypothetical protein n=1 Tax=Bacillus manliponensis TaxID=574376 RepID=UPI0035162D85
MKSKKKKMISIFAIISTFLLLVGCENKKDETLADKAFEENSKTEDREKEQQDAQLEDIKEEGRRAVSQTLPWQTNDLISNINDVAKHLNDKATTDTELKEDLEYLEMNIEEIETSITLLPEEYESIETNLKNLSKNSKTYITEAVKFHQGKGNADEVKKLLSEMLEDIVAIKNVLPLDDTDNGFYSVGWMKEFIQKQ